MATITNIVLNLQHGGPGTTITAQRTANITFTTVFNQVERLARAVFQADVKLVSKDSNVDDRILSVGTTYVQAADGPVQATVSKVFTRGNFDEDSDVIFVHTGGIVIREDSDEWVARVTLSPLVFGNVTANSDLVTGSWGSQGQD